MVKANWVPGDEVNDATLNDVGVQVNTHTSLISANAAAIAAGKLAPTAVKTSSYSATVTDLIPSDASAGGFTIALPSAPADKSIIGVKKIDTTSNVVTVQRTGSDVFNVASGASTLQLVLQDQTVLLQYKASGGIWYVTSHGAAIASLDSRYRQAAAPLTGALLPAQIVTLGDETYTVASGSVTQIAGTTIQGYSPAIGDRVFIPTAPAASGTAFSYSTSVQATNGLYVVTANTTNLTLARAADMSGSINPAGLTVFVENGSSWGGSLLWAVIQPASAAPFTYGTGIMECKPIAGVKPFWDAITLNTNTNPIAIWNGTGQTVVQASINAGSHTLTLPAGTATIGAKVAVPATATSTGSVGQWAADSSFYYACTAANTWRRVAIASW
jgi:Cu/Ag efflux protein CusF